MFINLVQQLTPVLNLLIADLRDRVARRRRAAPGPVGQIKKLLIEVIDDRMDAERIPSSGVRRTWLRTAIA